MKKICVIVVGAGSHDDFLPPFFINSLIASSAFGNLSTSEIILTSEIDPDLLLKGATKEVNDFVKMVMSEGRWDQLIQKGKPSEIKDFFEQMKNSLSKNGVDQRSVEIICTVLQRRFICDLTENPAKRNGIKICYLEEGDEKQKAKEDTKANGAEQIAKHETPRIAGMTKSIVKIIDSIKDDQAALIICNVGAYHVLTLPHSLDMLAAKLKDTELKTIPVLVEDQTSMHKFPHSLVTEVIYYTGTTALAAAVNSQEKKLHHVNLVTEELGNREVIMDRNKQLPLIRQEYLEFLGRLPKQQPQTPSASKVKEEKSREDRQ